jgi:hypothetical protein
VGLKGAAGSRSVTTQAPQRSEERSEFTGRERAGAFWLFAVLESIELQLEPVTVCVYTVRYRGSLNGGECESKVVLTGFASVCV